MNQEQEIFVNARKEEAIQELTKTIEINPKDYKAYFDRGSTLILGKELDDLGRKEEAIKDYTKAIEIDPFISLFQWRSISC